MPGIHTGKGRWEKGREIKYKSQMRHRVNHPVKSRVHNLLSSAKQCARLKGIDFDLSPKWAYNIVKNGKCAITGIPFDTVEYGKGYHSPFAFSIDRIDNNKGYTMDNCQWICWIVNRAKGNGSLEDLYIMARAIVDKFECNF